jgi:hypothetical protein
MDQNTLGKRFLAENAWWYKHYTPVFQNELAAYKAANPGKPCPSLALVLAIVKQESAGSSWAIRYEPAFHKWLEGRIKKNPALFKTYGPAISRATEVIMRSTSFGMFQIMGQTLREQGFKGQYLTECCDPQICANFGIKFLAKLMDKYNNEDAAIAAYNAGSPRKTSSGAYVNQPYVNSVKNFKAQWEYILSKGW